LSEALSCSAMTSAVMMAPVVGSMCGAPQVR
jgi:hypothetical protein